MIKDWAPPPIAKPALHFTGIPLAYWRARVVSD